MAPTMKISVHPQFLFIALTLQCFSLAVSATDYTAGINLDIDAKHDDNVRLVKSNKTAISGVSLSPELTFGADTELTKTALTTQLSSGRYNNSNFNTDNQNVQFSTAHKFEKSNLGLDLGLIRDSTLTSETVGSGRIGDKAERHQRYQVAPSASYSLTEIDQVKVQASISRDDYKSDQYSDYKYTTGNADWIHTLNERVQLVARLTYSDYESDFRDVSVLRNRIVPANSPPLFFPFDVVETVSDTQQLATSSRDKGLQLGAYYLPTEQTSINLLVGKSRNTSDYRVRDPHAICQDAIPSDFSYCAGLPSSSNSLLTAELDSSWKNETHQLSLSLAKSTQPTGDGYTLDSLQINGGWLYQLSELNQLNLKLSWIRNKLLNSSNAQLANSSDRNYGSALISFQRQLSGNWYANASYEHHRQDYTEANYIASSNIISLGIRYQPQQWHWSR
jgi:hypothetical protein